MSRIADRVKETTSTTGGGAYVLDGASAGFRSFTSAFSDGDTVEYAVTNGTDWEVGYGAFTASGATIARSTIRASSNGGNVVIWGLGTKDVWSNAPAALVEILYTLNANVATFLATPSSANLAAAVTGETGSGAVVFGTAPTISNPVLTGTVDLSSASSGQVKFPATQNPSADVNTLDDYEEGTWTPSVRVAGSASGITYDRQFGSYVKIGRLCVASFDFSLTSRGSHSGSSSVSLVGLPFAAATSPLALLGGLSLGFFSGLGTDVSTLAGYINATSTNLTLQRVNAAGQSGTTNLTFSYISDTLAISGTVSYLTD
jgi:hypothetical protein